VKKRYSANFEHITNQKIIDIFHNPFGWRHTEGEEAVVAEDDDVVRVLGRVGACLGESVGGRLRG